MQPETDHEGPELATLYECPFCGWTGDDSVKCEGCGSVLAVCAGCDAWEVCQGCAVDTWTDGGGR